MKNNITANSFKNKKKNLFFKIFSVCLLVNLIFNLNFLVFLSSGQAAKFDNFSQSRMGLSPSWEILTPAGYQDINQVKIGDEIIGYDFGSGESVINILEKIETVSPEKYNYWEQDANGNNLNYQEVPFTYYLINGSYLLFKDQSLFANGRLVHAHELELGDIIYTETGSLEITSLAENLDNNEWQRLIVSGNHSYYARLINGNEPLTSLILHNASRYWVGGGSSANWSATGSTNWGSASNTQDNASVPGASDDVIFDGVGTGASNSTLSASITINSLNMTGYANTLTHNAAVTLTIDANQLTLALGMIYTLANAATSAISLTSTTGTAETPTAITTAGKTLGNFTFNGAGGYFQLVDDLTLGTTATLTFTQGTFDANGQDVTTGLFASNNSNTRTLTMGNGTWTLTGNSATVWNMVTVTGFSLNRGNDVILNYSGATGTRTVSHGSIGGAEAVAVGFKITAGTDVFKIASNASQSIHNLIFDGFGGSLFNGRRNIYGNFTITANSSTMTLDAGTNITVFAATSGTKTITTGGKTLDFPITFNGVGGSWQLANDLTVGSTRTMTLTNGTFDANGYNVSLGLFYSAETNNRTLTMGDGTWTITGNNGTVWNVSRAINFTLNRGTNPFNYTYSGGTGTRTISSGYTSESNAPNIIISAGSDNVNISGSANNLDFTGFSGTLLNARKFIYGDITFSADMILSSGSSAITWGSANFAFDGPEKWRGGVLASNGKIYGIPYETPEILIIDPSAGTATTSFMGVDPAEMVGLDKWRGGVLATNNKIYSIPSYSDSILIIDPVAGTASLSNMGADLSGDEKWGEGILADDGKIYAVPNDSLSILIIDPAAGTASLSDMGADLSGVGKWRGATLGNDGKIYGIPFDAETILIIDPVAGTATTTNMGLDLSGENKWFGATLATNGKIYAIPNYSTNFLIIDPSTGTASLSDMGLDLTGDNKWRDGELAADGKIYGVPHHEDRILIIDPATNTATASDMGADLNGPNKWLGDVSDADGKVYGMPIDSNDILIIDPALGTAVRTTMEVVTVSGTKTLTTNGQTIDFPFHIQGEGGTFELADDLTLGSGKPLTFFSGTFNTNNFNITAGELNFTGIDPRAVNFGSSTVTLNGTGRVWSNKVTTGLTFAPGTSEVVFNAAGQSLLGPAVFKDLTVASSADLDLNDEDLTVSGQLTNNGTLSDADGSDLTLNGNAYQTVVLNSASLQNLTVTNATQVTFSDGFTLGGSFINQIAGSNMVFTAGETYTIGYFNLQGADGQRIDLRSSLSESPWYVNVTTANSTATYIAVSDSDASGGVTISVASVTNQDRGGNTNWLLEPQTTGGGTSFLAYANNQLPYDPRNQQTTVPDENNVPIPDPSEPSATFMEIINAEAEFLIQSDAKAIAENMFLPRNIEQENKSLQALTDKISLVSGLSASQKETISAFIVYGTPLTEKLGMGERAGVLQSFVSAFGRLPQTITDWQDILKISQGRWPSQTSEIKEDQVKVFFEMIYLRNPEEDIHEDQAAIDVMAYGIRPKNRNLNSEKTAMTYFTAIFDKLPLFASDWDIIRAIAYSGAKR